MSRRRRRRKPWSYQRRFAVAGLVLAAAVAIPAGIFLELHWLLAALAGVNLATFALYGWDKSSARASRVRVPESTLHLFCLVGGSPAAFVGQRVFRHKTRKGRFQTIFWALVVLQLGLLIWALVGLQGS